MVAGTGMRHAEYVRDVLFPDGKVAPGPSTRSGDFAEILVADYIEFVLGYWCPRDRYKGRFNRNDIDEGRRHHRIPLRRRWRLNAADELFVVEAKSGMTATAANRLQDAVTDSLKDALREAITLNALKQRMLNRGEMVGVNCVQRFQNEADLPFVRFNGAAAVLDDKVLATTDLAAVDAAAHGNSGRFRTDRYPGHRHDGPRPRAVRTGGR